MNIVQPIRDKKVLEEFKRLLRLRNYKYYIMTVIGLNTGLRISDILKLKVDGILGTHITIKEQKTGKYKRFLINDNLRNELDRYIKQANLTKDNYLIPSNKRDKNGNEKSISRVQAYNILKSVGDQLGINNIGTHTLRKTFGYFYYQQYKDIATLQKIFNHSSPSITLKYIGITDDIIDSTISNFSIWLKIQLCNDKSCKIHIN